MGGGLEGYTIPVLGDAAFAQRRAHAIERCRTLIALHGLSRDDLFVAATPAEPAPPPVQAPAPRPVWTSARPGYEPRPGTVAAGAWSLMRQLPEDADVSNVQMAAWLGVHPQSMCSRLAALVRVGSLFYRVLRGFRRGLAVWSRSDRTGQPYVPTDLSGLAKPGTPANAPPMLPTPVHRRAIAAASTVTIARPAVLDPDAQVVVPADVKITHCPSPGYDPRYQLPPGVKVEGEFSREWQRLRGGCA